MPSRAAGQGLVAAHWRSIDRAAELLGWAGVVVHGVALLGQRVSVVAKIETEEHEWRGEAGIGALVDYELLDRLVDLPYRVPISAGADEAFAGARASGAVEIDGGTVIRVVRRPCQVIGVLRHGDAWLRSIEEMSLFAPLAARAVILSGGTADDDAAELEAASLGVGLARCDRDGLEPRVTVLPKPTSPRLSTGSWLMAETVYAAWLHG